MRENLHVGVRKPADGPELGFAPVAEALPIRDDLGLCGEYARTLAANSDFEFGRWPSYWFRTRV